MLGHRELLCCMYLLKRIKSTASYLVYHSPSIIRMIKSRRMRWAGHVARMGEKNGYWWESQKERDHWDDQDVGGQTISKWILDRMGWCGLD
jgi:hypothetical protein